MDQADSKGATPLFVGSLNRRHEVVELLLAKGAEVDQAANNGGTPLSTSRPKGRREVEELPLASIAEVGQAPAVILQE